MLKRQRELRKAEKAALKRERRGQRKEEAAAVGGSDNIATQDDLAGYGFPTDDDEPAESES